MAVERVVSERRVCRRCLQVRARYVSYRDDLVEGRVEANLSFSWGRVNHNKFRPGMVQTAGERNVGTYSSALFLLSLFLSTTFHILA